MKKINDYMLVAHQTLNGVLKDTREVMFKQQNIGDRLYLSIMSGIRTKVQLFKENGS